MFHYFSSQFNRFDKLMLKAAVSVAFFALLRCAEFTSNSSHSWDCRVNLGIRDVSTDSKGRVSIFIKGSKTDPFRSGCCIQLTRLNSDCCPVVALKKYLSVLGYKDGPLFKFSDGAFLTRHSICRCIKVCFPNQNVNTHSFRIGGASLAAQSGISPLLIMKMGRWKSSAFLRYIHYEENELRDAQRKMVECRK